MTAPTVRFVAGRKFMWDGRVYPSQDDAAKAQAAYQHDGFETCTCEGEGAFLVYTRRAIKQVTDEKSN